MRPGGSAARGSTRPLIAVALLLALAIALIYGQVARHEFVPYYDDGKYVTENQQVLQGVRLEGVRWAFTNSAAANWHPLTWLSHMLDVQLFGVTPGPHHLVNVAFHLVNALLVLLVLHRLTGALWRSALAALLFAVHPLNVESVAWVAERKNVLSTAFGLAALWAYLAYARTRRLSNYGAMLLLFAAALLSKPMLVTLPFLLLLLDFWPLNRVRLPLRLGQLVGLVREKAPLFLMAALSSAVTYLVQSRDGTVKSLDAFPFPERLANALSSYAKYVARTFSPHGLGALYSYPRQIEWVWAASGLILLLCVSLLAGRFARRSPAIFVGWFWFVGMLVPVIGLVQVWLAGSADRYMYLPSLGLFILVAWGLPPRAAAGDGRRAFGVVAAALTAVVGLGASSYLQTAAWKDEITLFRRTLAVTRANWVAENYLGFMLAKAGLREEALQHYREAIRINPGYAEPYVSLGQAMASRGRMTEAIAYYRKAIEIDPAFVRAHLSLGMALSRLGRRQEALQAYRKVVELDPSLKGLVSRL